MDRAANAAFYGSSTITPEQIFASSGNAAPAVANNFVQVLSAQTRRLPQQPGMEGRGSTDRSSSAPDGAQRGPEASPAVRTFGIADPDAEDDDEGQYENF